MALVAASARAACVPSSSGPIAPSADTYADVNNPTLNFGSADGWNAASTTAGFASGTESQQMHGYVKYPLPRIPAGCTLNRAIMRIAITREYVVLVPNTYPAPLYIRPAAAAWSETTLTWNNQPGPAKPSAKIANEMMKGRWDITDVIAALYSRGNTGLELLGKKPNIWFAPNSREYLAKYGNRGIPYLAVSWK
jgi:hypothetical protein